MKLDDKAIWDLCFTELERTDKWLYKLGNEPYTFPGLCEMDYTYSDEPPSIHEFKGYRSYSCMRERGHSGRHDCRQAREDRRAFVETTLVTRQLVS